MTAEDESPRDNVNSRPSSMHLPNAEWREADRLGRLLLDTFDAQDARRQELIIIEIPNQGEDNDE
jgi:hypothetical protein